MQTETTRVVSMTSPDYNIMQTEPDQLQHMSNRYKMWEVFAKEVGDHIESYTIPQYGDYPNDQMTDWTIGDFKTDIKKRANRMGNNARGKEEDIRDMLKIAHEVSIAWTKMMDKEKEYNAN